VDEAFMDVSTLRKTISGIAGDLGFGSVHLVPPFQSLGKPVDNRTCPLHEIVNELQEAARR